MMASFGQRMETGLYLNQEENFPAAFNFPRLPEAGVICLPNGLQETWAQDDSHYLSFHLNSRSGHRCPSNRRTDAPTEKGKCWLSSDSLCDHGKILVRKHGKVRFSLEEHLLTVPPTHLLTLYVQNSICRKEGKRGHPWLWCGETSYKQLG